MIALLLALACRPEPAAVPTPAPEPDPVAGDTPEPLDDVALLERLSLDLRGVRPTPAEVAAVEADPAAIDTMVDTFLADPRFGERVQDLWGDVLLTRQDTWQLGAEDFGLDDEIAFAAAVGEEPLRLLRRVAEEDLPWTEAVTGDWTMADEHLAAAWPVDYPGGATGWQVVRYTDGRPAAGVLATNGLWWRYRSTEGNANRGRANAISRALLCNDYLDREIEFDRSVDLLDEEAVKNAVATNPACVACHVSLDPLASFLYGFWHTLDYSAPELTQYHAERESLWEEVTGTPPGYYGEPGYGLADLGRFMADDERYVSCFVQRTFTMLHQRDPELDDTDALVAHREALLAGGLTVRSVVRSVVASPTYRSADEARGGTLRMLSVDQLGSVIEDSTGFRLTIDGVDQLRSSEDGLRTLAGGADGNAAIRPAELPSATSLLVVERVAEAAADHVVRADAAAPDEARLFVVVAPTTGPDDDPDGVVDQIRHLHLVLLGDRVAADGPEVAANLELWRELYAIDGDATNAWVGVVTALLRDPELLVY